MGIDDIGRYLRTMEHSIVDALGVEGIEARSRHHEGIDYTGVWVQDRKIASIGVHVSRGVTTHGFAVNVDLDLEPFSWVVACGLPDVQMTSIAHEIACLPPAMGGAPQWGSVARAPGLSCFRKEMAYRFCEAHGKRQRLVSAARLGIAPRPAICAAPTGAEPVKSFSSASLEAVSA
jgi:lipoyl(octanoyl) transferase